MRYEVFWREYSASGRKDEPANQVIIADGVRCEGDLILFWVNDSSNLIAIFRDADRVKRL